MSTTKTTALLHRSARLEPGELDREVLARALTFALDSVRAGFIEPTYRNDFDATPGIVDGLFWNQDSWLLPDADAPYYSYVVDTLEDLDEAAALRRQGKGCGTGCCIAGWIDLASGTPALDELGVTRMGVADRATRLLVGFTDYWDEDLPGLPAGVGAATVHSWIGYLFSGSNTLPDVIRHADDLLELYGQPPLTLDPTGTFR